MSAQRLATPTPPRDLWCSRPGCSGGRRDACTTTGTGRRDACTTMRNVAVLGLLAALVAGTATAQEVLSLEQAIEIAEAGNHELEAADARLGAAEAGIDEAHSYRLPRLDLKV